MPCLGWSLRRCSTQHGPQDSVATAKRDALAAENFEHLIKHLLEAMEFEQVRVSSNQRDGGIDVEASVCEGRGVCSTSAES